jgi:Trypsin-like peptidase domain
VPSVPLRARVVEVIADLGETVDRRYRYGSGCIVRGGTVLTAAHVVTDAVSAVVRGTDKREYKATVDQHFVGDVTGSGPDLALLEINDPKFNRDLPPIRLAAVDRDSPSGEPVKDAQAVGYPWFAETRSRTRTAVRDTVDATGVIPVLSHLATGLLSVQVRASPRELPPQEITLEESQWSGMSGAPVFAAGCLLGVVTEHAPREGPSAVTAVPLTALQADPVHVEWGRGVANPAAWWSRLGVGGPDDLQRLPVPRQPRPEAQHATRSAELTTDQLRKIAGMIAATPQLKSGGGLDALFAALRGELGVIARTSDPDADLLNLVSAILDQQAPDALLRALLSLAANNDAGRIAAVTVRRHWDLQVAIAPLLGSLQLAPWVQVEGALAETACDVPAHVTDVDRALDWLADLPRPGSAASPLAEFIVRLQGRRKLEVPDGWFANQGLDEAAAAALKTRVAREAGLRRKLVIDLRESTPGQWQNAVTGYLGPKWCLHTAKCEPDIDGVRGAVVDIVGWATSQTGNLAIGFLVGYHLFREMPEQWKYEDERIGPIRLCKAYPVVLHAAERVTIPQLRPVWDRKLAAVEASAVGQPSVLWLDRDDAAEIWQHVQVSNAAYVAFTFVPEARPDRRRTAVWAAIAAGAPYVVWVQAAPADGYKLRKRLGKLLGPIGDFPATLLNGRARDPYMAGALRVIWDGLDELPPYLERLGEELKSGG